LATYLHSKMGHLYTCNKCKAPATIRYYVVIPIGINSLEYESGAHPYMELIGIAQHHSEGHITCAIFRCKQHPLDNKWYKDDSVSIVETQQAKFYGL